MSHPIEYSSEIMGGEACFAGTRVPIRNLFDLLGRGRSLTYFLEQFPTVSKEQVLAVLQLAADDLSTPPAPAA